MKYDYCQVPEARIFFRESGDSQRPVLLLLHGFPSASHMFRQLMPLLDDAYHVIAPDYPGFGLSDLPDRSVFTYSFAHLADVVDAFLEAKGVTNFFMYVFDYGAPIGFRLALKYPERIRGIVTQNGNIYLEGLGEKWAARAEYWKHPTPALRERYKSAFAPATIIGQYTHGAPPNSVAPDGYSLDILYTQRPGYAEAQSDLIFDYQNNVALYPEFQAYLRRHQPPLLAVWGKNDPSFIPAGAEAFRRDLPRAEIRFVDSGHFALESHCAEIAAHMRRFLSSYAARAST